jgi:hypothetical protein
VYLVAPTAAPKVRMMCLQCGISGKDFGNLYNAERIEGGPVERPCTVANATHPAADHAGHMVAGLAAAAALMRDGTTAERTEAAAWMSSAKKVLAWASQHPGIAKGWFSDVCTLLSCYVCHIVSSMAECGGQPCDPALNDSFATQVDVCTILRGMQPHISRPCAWMCRIVRECAVCSHWAHF